MNTAKVTYEYRDYGNNHVLFERTYNLSLNPNIRDLEVGQEIAMGKFNTLKLNQFFRSKIWDYDFDEELDHHTFVVNEIEFDE